MFDEENSGTITEERFLRGLELFCKCSEEQKIKHLYDLYLSDEQETGISYEGFLCILRNYPQDQIGTLTSDYGTANKVLDASNYQSVSDIRSKYKNLEELLDEKNDSLYVQVSKEEAEMEEMTKPIGIPLCEYLNKKKEKEEGEEQMDERIEKPNESGRKISEEQSSKIALSRRSSILGERGTNAAATKMDKKIKAYAMKVMEEYGRENQSIDFANFRKFIKNHRVILDQFMMIFQESLWTETTDANNRPLLGFFKMY